MRELGIGLLISFVVLFLVAGPNAFQMVVILVVCTGGLGLIPVLGVSWLVGLLVLSCFRIAGSGGTG